MAKGPFYDEGVHVCEVTNQAIGQSSNGNLQFVFKFKVLGVPEGEDGFAPHRVQYERTMWLTVTENTLEWIAPALERLGFDGSVPSRLDPGDPQHISLVGNQFNGYCKHEENQSRVLVERWNVSNPAASVLNVQSVPQAKLRKLDALFGKSVKGGRAAGSAPAREAARRNDYEVTDDDIPF